MSYTTPSYQSPAPAARPGTVSLATTLLYALTLLSVISIALTIYTATFYDAEKIEQIYVRAGMDAAAAQTQAAAATVGTYIGAGFALLITAGYLVSAIFVGQGKQWARILAWVWAGLFGICCGIGGLFAQGFSGALSSMGGNVGGVDMAQANKEIQELIPSWMTSATLVLGIISLLAAIGVVVLLALPPSNPFFKKPEAQFTPPPYPAP